MKIWAFDGFNIWSLEGLNFWRFDCLNVRMVSRRVWLKFASQEDWRRVGSCSLSVGILRFPCCLKMDSWIFAFWLKDETWKMQISVLDLSKNEIEGFLVFLRRDMGKMNWRKADFWIYGLVKYEIVLCLGAGIIILKMMCLCDLGLFLQVLVLFCGMDGMTQEQTHFDVGKQKMGGNRWDFSFGLF